MTLNLNKAGERESEKNEYKLGESFHSELQISTQKQQQKKKKKKKKKKKLSCYWALKRFDMLEKLLNVHKKLKTGQP